MTGQHIRLQLVDDHEVVRAGLRHLLENEVDMRVVGESASGKEACCDYEQHEPDIVIMDVSLPDMSGLEVMRRILSNHPKARILMLSMHGGMVAERAIQMGARGFICKRSGARELVKSIHLLMAGETYLDPAAEISETSGEGAAGLSLSKRELEVCLLLAEGRSVAEIADQLYLSEKTVYTHRQHVMDKLGVSTSVELAQLVMRLGMQPNA
ncbi:MAG TPA: response regulator transcription factor [Mariprofundaceae bacterium]|nr:response regulator transcription factor [Mariprofundaceae bacterium]